MTLRASVAPWQRPARRSRLADRGQASCSARSPGSCSRSIWPGICSCGGCRPIRARRVRSRSFATPTTTGTARTCGSGWLRPRRWRRVVVGAVALIALLPKARSLHGDARFATRREIARAGLVRPAGDLPRPLRAALSDAGRPAGRDRLGAAAHRQGHGDRRAECAAAGQARSSAWTSSSRTGT